MRRRDAAIASGGFFLAAPTVVTGVLPWLLTGWRAEGDPLRRVPVTVAGSGLIAGGAGVLISSFARFVHEGRGTPVPIAPTERLVTGGLYRYVRNPMYLAVVALIVGQALVLLRPVLLVHALIVWAVMAGFARVYEEPTLRRCYGPQYDAYRAAVPAWIPRVHARRRRPAPGADVASPPPTTP